MDVIPFGAKDEEESEEVGKVHPLRGSHTTHPTQAGTGRNEPHCTEQPMITPCGSTELIFKTTAEDNTCVV